uniref:Phosphomannomutase n=1 Tax=Globisporangium ultimum (strain ATCC 200006 / CBS 805.95 / DAOM BR144) TaxID=431595 RepID=K3X5L5_GLOUD
MAPTKNARVIALFDVDGTLTPARKTVSAEMTARLQQLRQQITIGVVGGSDLVKQKEQLGENVVNEFDYSFSENGLVAFHNGAKVGETSLKRHFTNEQLNRFVNYVLHYIADLDIPIKRGTFLEFRMGMINVSPIGRNCSQDERDEFEKYDAIHNTYALRFLDPKDYDEIHFFGDKTHQGGNDYEIYTHERTIGHAVSSPEDTIRILNELFPWVN